MEWLANPDPVNNGSQNVSFDKVLGWVPGYGATSHDIYFGTDAAAVAAAQRLPGDLDADGQVDYEDLSIHNGKLAVRSIRLRSLCRC